MATGSNLFSSHEAKKLVNTYGSTTQPVYINSGVPTNTTYTLGSTVSAGTANRLAYYSGANTLSATGHYSSSDKIAINSTSAPSYNLYVNGTSYFNGTSYHNGAVTMNSTMSWTGNSALPERSSVDYFVNIDAFADGGKTYWTSRANVITSLDSNHKWVRVAGDTMTGLLTTTSSSNHSGIKIGNNYITAINGELIFQNNTSIRFGADSWDYNVWAGLKYVSSSKAIYLGLADGSAFTANSAQSGGTLYLPGIRYFSINGKTAIDANDSWLRINEGGAFSSGVYFGSNTVRTDGQLQVGSSGGKFYANSSGNGYFSNTLGIAGTNTSYKLYVNGSSYFNGTGYLAGNFYIGASGAGGYINGAGASNGGINSILIGDDVWLGDCNVGGIMGMKSTSTNAGFYFYNSSGTKIGHLYCQSNTRLRTDKEIAVEGLSAASHIRMVQGNYGVLLRNDGSDFYILLTASGDQYGSWQTPAAGHPLRINLGTGYSYFSRAYGAVWNDYAEYRKSDITEPGRCVREVGDDTLVLTDRRLQPGCEIVSDTFGFAIGETEDCKTPIASSGRVLAYPWEDREEFRKHIGEPVCSGPDGTVSIMTPEEEMMYPSRIIGTISAVPDYEEWGSGNVKVNGRVWIRIR